METKIARTAPMFEGAPMLHVPPVIGFSPNKPFVWRIPATGKRPISFAVDCLPEGLEIFDGILRGTAAEGEYTAQITAENELGKSTSDILIKVTPDGICQTPLMGFTSWNAYRNRISSETMKKVADSLVSSGLADYGYRYVNTDSGWQGEYGGEFDAVMPNENFPDMNAVTDYIHEKGLCFGLYTSPFTMAWGGGVYPGCTKATDGTMDQIVGDLHYEKNNAKQLVAWNIDYLKYDWQPCRAEMADLMKSELLASERDVAFCCTVYAHPDDAWYWQKNCTSWRANGDSHDNWDIFLNLLKSADDWLCHIRPGHYFDLDMLETGFFDGHQCSFTEDEQLATFTMRAFLSSPIQISCEIEKLTQFDFDMLCNDEILALHADNFGVSNITFRETCEGSCRTRVYTRPIEDGFAVAVFNLGDTDAKETITLDGKYRVRDLWAREDLPEAENSFVVELKKHTVRVFKFVK